MAKALLTWEMSAPGPKFIPVTAASGSNESPNERKHDAHAKNHLMVQLVEKIGRSGPNGAPSAPARETRDVSSRA